jgi:hypothetical protein
MRRGLLALGLVLLASCADRPESSGIPACISDNPAGEPFDVGDVEVASAAPGDTGPAPAPPSAASIAAVCRAEGGTGCEPAAFISKEAAACIATINHFEAGLEPWKVALVYHHRFARVVWNVTSTLQDDGPDGYSGAVLTLDASDGLVLEESGFNVTP